MTGVKLQAQGLLKPIDSLVSSPWRIAAFLLVLALSFTNIYRAGTQSISHDEAVIYGWLLSGSWGQVLNFEHGNHHVVTDLLSKLMITVFGTSEIALRIPALLGGALYFFSVWRICVLLFGDAFLFLLSVAFLCLNPFVLDYLCCARGYGLALGFFSYALYNVILYLAEPPEGGNPSRPVRLLNKAGVTLGLSIGSNAIMVFPGGALIASLFTMLFVDSVIREPEAVEIASVKQKTRITKKPRRRNLRREASAGPRTGNWQQMFVHLMLPAAVIGGFISLLPKRLIELEVGYLGPPSLFAILEGLVRYSFLHSPAGFRGLAAWFPAETAIRLVTYIVAPASLVGLVALAVRILDGLIRKRSMNALPALDRFLLLLGGMLPVTIVLIVLSRYVFEQPYPELRTVMYWIPLFGLACLVFLRRLSQGRRIERIFSVPVAVILVLSVAQFVTQFNTRYFAEWVYCAAGKDTMQIVRAEHAGKTGSRVKVGATWQLEPVINFYRVAWGLDWMDPVYREGPDNPHYDYYVLAFGDTSLVERLHLRALLTDRLSATVLAKRADL